MSAWTAVLALACRPNASCLSRVRPCSFPWDQPACNAVLLLPCSAGGGGGAWHAEERRQRLLAMLEEGGGDDDIDWDALAIKASEGGAAARLWALRVLSA